MKYAKLATIGLGVAFAATTAQAQAPAARGEVELKTAEQKIAYTIGMSLGRDMKRQGFALDPMVLAQGLSDAMADKAALTDAQMTEVMQAFRTQMIAKQKQMMDAQGGASGPEAEKNLKAGQAYLAANKSKPGVTTLPSGVQFKVLKEGTGAMPKLDDTVIANYRGTLIDGTEFDSSYKRGKPAEFPVGGVIKGWTEILQKMKVGEKVQVFIPAEMAYGAPDHGPIPGNSALVFDIELVGIK